jgi:hypothetical protein
VAALGAAAILVHYVAQGRFLEAGLVVVGLAVVAMMVGAAAGYLGQRLAGTPIRSAMMRSKWLPMAVLTGGLVVSTAPPKYVAGLEPAAAGPFYKRYNVLFGDPRPLRELYGFARSTAPESQFLIPPNLKSFRLFAERAVVVDRRPRPGNHSSSSNGIVGWNVSAASPISKPSRKPRPDTPRRIEHAWNRSRTNSAWITSCSGGRSTCVTSKGPRLKRRWPS